jgi:aspartyl protease family protein
MLRSVIVIAVLACVVGIYAPSVLPGLLASADGGAMATSPPLPAPVVRPQPVIVQTAASEDNGERVVRLEPDARGQYSTEVVINGVLVRMMVDTGATLVTLSADTAQRIGLPLTDASYTGRTQTANGIGRAAPVTLSAVSIGDIYVPTVQGMVLDRSAGDVNLLGMSFLRRLSAVEQKSGKLVLRQ